MAITAIGEAVPDAMELTAEEVDLILKHREAKQKLRIARINGISQAIGAALQDDPFDQWPDWPGTQFIARSVYDYLVTAGTIKE